MAFDGQVLWVTDAKTKLLNGYDIANDRHFKPIPLKLPGIRDIAFYKNILIGVYPKYLYLIDPINGNVVEKRIMPLLSDPISIAIDKGVAYIYNRKDHRIYRYDLEQKEFFGSFEPGLKKLRGMTFFKGYLWAVDKSNRANKLDLIKGEVLSFVPLPLDAYGITFVKGSMYASTPFKAQSIDYIEAANFVAASQKRYRVYGRLLLKPIWNQEQRKNHRFFHLKFKAMTFNAHQRHSSFKFRGSSLRLKRRQDGESLLEQSFEGNDQDVELKFSFKLRSFNLTYIWNSENIKEYFKNLGAPEHTLKYTRIQNYDLVLTQKIDEVLVEWHKYYSGVHPHKILPFLIKRGITKLDEQIYFFRKLGIPARKVQLYYIKEKSLEEVLQFYVRPIGWLCVTNSYQPEREREYPISNDVIEVYFPDSIELKPKLSFKKNQRIKADSESVEWIFDRVEEEQ